MSRRRTYWDTETGKMIRSRAVFLAVFLIILGSPTYALRYDLQPYTTCTNGVCQTSLDVSTLGLSQNKINALKTVNITNFLTKSGIINDFAYYWNNNVLTITGRVVNNVYWSFGAGGDSYDPWWNVTITEWSNATVHQNPNSPLGSISASAGYYRGGNITTRNRIHIVNFTYISGVGGCTGAKIIRVSDKALIEEGSINDATKVVTFSTNDLANNTPYYILLNCTNRSMKGASPNWVSDAFTYSSAFIYTNDLSTFSAGANEFEQIESIATQNYSTYNTSFFYDTELYLNGNASNMTSYNNKAVNISGGLVGNLSGSWNLTIYINGTAYNTSANNVTNTTNLTANGLYPITLRFYGNATLPEFNKTYYFNITDEPATLPTDITYTITIDMNDAPLTCFNTTHAVRNSTLSVNGSSRPLSEFYACPFGCENSACKLDPLYQGFLSFAVLAGFIVVLLFLDKVLKR